MLVGKNFFDPFFLCPEKFFSLNYKFDSKTKRFDDENL
jgi:hypothetical protein